jgi:hypothetical protein
MQFNKEINIKKNQEHWTKILRENLIKSLEIKIGNHIIYDSNKDMKYNLENNLENNFENNLESVNSETKNINICDNDIFSKNIYDYNKEIFMIKKRSLKDRYIYNNIIQNDTNINSSYSISNTLNLDSSYLISNTLNLNSSYSISNTLNLNSDSNPNTFYSISNTLNLNNSYDYFYNCYNDLITSSCKKNILDFEPKDIFIEL